MEKRSRNAGATRQAILDSAITAFTRHGYNGVGVREIAAEAAVTAMLVNRYFGSKEGLFTEVVDTVFAPPTVVPVDAEAPVGMARTMAEALVARTAIGAEHLGPFELMLKSAANPRAAEIVRAGIERHVGARFEAAPTGSDTRERAEIGLAVLAGIWLMRSVIATPALRDAQPHQLADRLSAMLAVVVEP
jgi:AcrR family transcriptional regulator